jgi:hypothetical protein
MARFVITDASITVNSVDLSDHMVSITLNYDADPIVVDRMGVTSHVFEKGLYNITLDVTFQQDFAASEVDATLSAIMDSATGTTTVVVKPTSSAVGATNPSFSIADAFLASYAPVAAGAPGELALAVASFQGGTLTRATS